MFKLKFILIFHLLLLCGEKAYSQNRIKVLQPGNGVFLLDTIVNIKWDSKSTTNSFFEYKLKLASDSIFTTNVQVLANIVAKEVNLVLNQNKTYYYQITGYNVTNYNDSVITSVKKFSTINYDLFQKNLLHYSSENVTLSGNIITKINDNSSFSNGAIQNNANQRAIQVPNVLNGKPAMRFDGVDDVYFFTAVDSIRTALWIIMDKIATPSSVQYYRYLLGSNTKYDFARYLPSHCVANFAATSIYTAKYGINKIPVDGQTQGLPAMKPCLVTMKTLGGYGSASNFSLDRGIYPRVWDGDVFRIVLFKDTLKDSEINSFGTYLMDYYSPPINLGNYITTCASNYNISANRLEYNKWLWSNGDTNSSITISTSGSYWVQTTDIFNRVSRDTVFVQFDTSNYKVKLPNDTFVCKGSIFALNAGPSHLSYTWNTGDTTSSKIINVSGTYIVSVKNCKNNTYLDTIVLFVSDRKPNLPDSAIYCHNSNVTLDPLLSGNLIYLWNTNATTKTITVNTVGTYILQVKDSLACVFKDTILVKVDSTLKNISLGIDKSLCNGNKFGLTISSTSINKFLWSTGDTIPKANATITGNYWVEVSNSNTCKKRDTILITILGNAPILKFLINDRCEGLSTLFQDQSIPPSGNSISGRIWKFTPTDSSLAVNANYSYPTKGIKVVTLSVFTNVGCSADTSLNVYIYQKPKANFITGVNCAHSKIGFNNISTFDPLDSEKTWNWNFGDGITAISKTPSHSYDTNKSYLVTLIVVSKNQCTDTLRKNLDIFPEINLDFNVVNSCINDTSFFVTNSVSKSIVSYNWNFGNSKYSSGKEVYQVYPASGNYEIVLAVENAIGCRDTFTKFIDIVSKPVVSILSDGGCINSKFGFKEQTTTSPKDSIIQYQWIINLKDTLYGKLPTYYFKDTGNYIVGLNVKTKLGCQNKSSKKIIIEYIPVANFIMNPNTGDIPIKINFRSTSTHAVFYKWNIANKDTFVDSVINYTFNQNGKYLVSLKVSNNVGCDDVMSRELDFNPTSLDIMLDKLVLKEIKDNNGTSTYYISVRINNLGSRIIKNIEFAISEGKGILFSENWSGQLDPGKSEIVTLKAKPVYELGQERTFVCINAASVNIAESEKNIINNEVCANTNNGLSIGIYPVPVKDKLHFNIATIEDRIITIDVFNDKGREVIKSSTLKLLKGLNKVEMNASQWARGVYIIGIVGDNYEQQIKFIVE